MASTHALCLQMTQTHTKKGGALQYAHTQTLSSPLLACLSVSLASICQKFMAKTRLNLISGMACFVLCTKAKMGSKERGRSLPCLGGCLLCLLLVRWKTLLHNSYSKTLQEIRGFTCCSYIHLTLESHALLVELFLEREGSWYTHILPCHSFPLIPPAQTIWTAIFLISAAKSWILKHSSTGKKRIRMAPNLQLLIDFLGTSGETPLLHIIAPFSSPISTVQGCHGEPLRTLNYF